MTPAILLLHQHAVGFRTDTYEHVANNTNYGHEAVSALNLSIHQVYKTLICQLNSMELVVVVLPAAVSLNLKHLALEAGAKNAQLALPRQVQAATGYLLGGISPLAQKRNSEPLLM